MSKLEKKLLIGIVVLLVLLSFVICGGCLSNTEKSVPAPSSRGVKKDVVGSETYIQGGYLKEERFGRAKYFPVAGLQKDESFIFDDSFGGARNYGGERKHEGVDIMTPDNIRGTYPVIAVSDGVVEHIGWLELGGYRIGIRTQEGIYYYYAHLYRYDTQLKEGSPVAAGQILGYVGDSGYGEEGTIGQFAVHLHFGIYVRDENGEEFAVNPYPFLKNFRNKLVKFFD